MSDIIPLRITVIGIEVTQLERFQRRNLPSHSVLRSFETAARHESFTLAAEELHLTQSAISRQVKELEATVGTELFRRVGRRVALTSSGRNLASDLAVDLENIRRSMMRAISAGEMGATLRIASLPTFASKWLVPKLPDFAKQNPEIEISLSSRHKPFDLPGEHFDLAIHFGQANWPETDMKLLCSETMVAVSAPLFRSDYNIQSAVDIARVPLLHMATRPTAWMDFFEASNLTQKTALKGKYFDQFSMTIAGAEASLGAALVPAYLIEQELSAGTLVMLSNKTITTDNSYYLVTPKSQQNSAVDALCDWMLGCVGKSSI